jgi:beta-fructofuranosidase
MLILQIDRSIIESFGDGGRACITSRVYPLLAIEKDAHLYVFNNGSQSVVISKLNAWSMKQAKIGHDGNINCA